MKKYLPWILGFAGIGVIAYFFLRKPAAGAIKPGTNANTANPLASIFPGLFGTNTQAQRQLDNTGSVITASGGAFKSLADGLSSLFGSPNKPAAAATSTKAAAVDDTDWDLSNYNWPSSINGNDDDGSSVSTSYWDAPDDLYQYGWSF